MWESGVSRIFVTAGRSASSLTQSVAGRGDEVMMVTVYMSGVVARSDSTPVSFQRIVPS
jgi:hypothetical protein